MLASVHTTQDVPERSTFVPGLLPHTLLDTLSFIALKCMDERNIHYAFKVDGMSRGPGSGWLRLVHAASGPMEQNLEACVTGIHFRAMYPLHKGEPLLVWCDGQEHRARAGAHGLHCPRCQQEFRGEFSFLSHARFLCPTPSKRLKRITNFHSLAQDMEGERAGQAGEEGWRSVLLEKTNHLKGDPSPPRAEETPRAGTARRVKAERGQSAFTEVRRVPQGAGESGKVAPSSAFSPVPTARGGYMDSAFGQSCAGRAPGCCDASGDVTVANVTRYRAGILPPPEYSLLPKTQARPAPPEMWPKPRGGPAAHCPPLLPATFTPLGATAQNWCAKCSLSFRMTSDLVLHMRSRHKRDAVGETQRRRRREPELSCPVCCEDFRERHHLSRHMTSHC